MTQNCSGKKKHKMMQNEWRFRRLVYSQGANDTGVTRQHYPFTLWYEHLHYYQEDPTGLLVTMHASSAYSQTSTPPWLINSTTTFHGFCFVFFVCLEEIGVLYRSFSMQIKVYILNMHWASFCFKWRMLTYINYI